VPIHIGTMKKSLRLICLCGLALLAVQTFAQGAAAVGQGMGTQEEGLKLIVNDELSYDTNILQQRNNPLSSRLWQFNPRLSYGKNIQGGNVSLIYDVIHYRFLDSMIDTHTNRNFTITVDRKINKYNKLQFFGSYANGSEQRGSGFSEGPSALSLNQPTGIQTKGLLTTYQLGADDHKMRFIASFDVRSTDRDSPAIINDARDYKDKTYGLQLLYRVGSRTDLALEHRDRTVSYTRTPVDATGTRLPLDSEEHYYLLGFNMDASAKTTARLRAGVIDRQFRWNSATWDDVPGGTGSEPAEALVPASVQFPADSGTDLYLEAAIVWSPSSYSRYEVSTRSSNREALGLGNYIHSKDYTLNWTHNWSERVDSSINFIMGTDLYRGSTREDRRKLADLKMAFDFGQSLIAGFGVRYQTVASNFTTASFDKNVFYIFANYSQTQGQR
jgi:polysaccharide biosynthesis protein VpsM